MKLFGRCVWHRFGNWKVIEQGPLVLVNGPERKEIGTYRTQERECADCHLVQLRSAQVFFSL